MKKVLPKIGNEFVLEKDTQQVSFLDTFNNNLCSRLISMADIENNSKQLYQFDNGVGKDYLKKVLKMNFGGTQRDDFTNSELCQLAINNYFQGLYKEDSRGLYKLELTYKFSESIKEHRTIAKDTAQKYFIQFHTRFVLPNLYGRHYENKKKQQPICYAFLECHQANEFHHHAIYAVNESDTSFFDKFIGENTFIDIYDSMYSKSKNCLANIRTSYLQRIDVEVPTQVIYATKQLKQFNNDYLVFPDSQIKRKNKHQLTKPNYLQQFINDSRKLKQRFDNLHK